MKNKRGDPCIFGDGKPSVAHGWCSKHYYTWQKYGDPSYQTREYKPQDPVCSTPDCGKESHAHGLCKNCYKRHRTHGTVTDPRERRFWAQVDKRGADECWPWTGYTQKNGYGVRSNHRPGETRLAHRIAYELLVGPIPPGLVLDHTCHNNDPTCRATDECPHRRCCNPVHLDPVTRRTNNERGNGGDSWGYVQEALPVRVPAQLPLTCTEDGGRCGKPIYKRTICRMHYRRWLRDPTVIRPTSKTPEDRFWEKVDKEGAVPAHKPELGPCWLWKATVNRKTGYGNFYPKHGLCVGAHRYAFALSSGAVPEGLDVHHVCYVRRCVNPAHLEARTRAENLELRMNRRAT